jgi:hypothetical protein
MLPLIGALGGGAWGAWLAKKRGGGRADMAQYGAGFAIFWGLIGVVAAIWLAR